MFNLHEEIGGLDINFPLQRSERYLGSNLFSRSTENKVTVYYLDSSDQIEIPGGYINLFSLLNLRVSDKTECPKFIFLGLNLPDIFFHQTDSRGIRDILSNMVILGTSGVRRQLPDLPPWTLSNINDIIEI